MAPLKCGLVVWHNRIQCFAGAARHATGWWLGAVIEDEYRNAV
jgi:hypothetical protein